MSTTSRKPLIERSPAHAAAAAAAATAAAASAANGTTPRKSAPGCRYIASRTSMNYEVANYVLLNSNVKENVQDGFAVNSNEEYRSYLNSNLLNNSNRILAFKNKPPPPPEGFESNARLMYSETSNSQTSGLKRKAPSRHIPQNAERTLDAPELLDDYYLNLLDWGAKNVLAVALGNTVYLWNASSGSIQELMQAEGPITSVGWAPDGKHIGVGLDNGDVQLWDSFALCKVRTMRGHSARVGSLAWNGGPVLSSGSRDNNIFNHDVRIRDHLITKMTSHQQEVCGLKWSLSGQQLASGGNDNLLHIWDASMMAAGSNAPAPFLHQFNEHQAAVKALAWCPFQSNLLASGGGTSDRCIKFWNTQTGTCLNSVDTNSQVCALQWSKHEKELLSSHGFSQNQLCLWKYPSMTKMAELRGHTSRVLHMAQSPDGFTVASAAADETLRFWQVFGSADNSFKQQQPTRPRKMVYSAATMIR